MKSQLSLLMQRAGVPENDLGKATVFANGDVRIALPAMRDAPWQVEGAWPVRGFHGTTPAGAIGILQTGAIRGGQRWPIVFFSGAWHCSSAADMRAAFLQTLAKSNPAKAYGIVFETVVKTWHEAIDEGGHDAETLVCQRVGRCHYRGSNARWTANPSAVSAIALWIAGTADFRHELVGFEDL